MAWIEVHQSLINHRKIILLADLLDIQEAHVGGHLIWFWLWCLDNAPSGLLDGITPRMIARAAQWNGDPEVFIDALTESGFLDDVDGQLEIHDWDLYAGRLIEKREDNAKRMKEARARKKAERATHVQHTFDARAGATNTTVPTEHNQQHQPNANTHMSLSLDKYCDEIQFEMIANGVRSSFIVQDNDLKQVKSIHTSGVPIEFVKECINHAFKQKKDIKSFAYIAPIVISKWANYQARAKPGEPIDFSLYIEAAATKERASSGPYVPNGIPEDLLELEREREEMRRHANGDRGS